MFCVSCGAKNPDHAKFCSSCGAETVASHVPSPAKAESSPAAKAEAVESCPEPPRKLLPYRWGKFQGGICLLTGIVVLLSAIIMLAAGHELGERMTELAIVSPLVIVGGYAFYRRKKFAVTMTYVWIVLTAGGFVYTVLTVLSTAGLTSEQRVGQVRDDFGLFVVQLLFWALCCRYYRRRRSELT